MLVSWSAVCVEVSSITWLEVWRHTAVDLASCLTNTSCPKATVSALSMNHIGQRVDSLYSRWLPFLLKVFQILCEVLTDLPTWHMLWDTCDYISLVSIKFLKIAGVNLPTVRASTIFAILSPSGGWCKIPLWCWSAQIHATILHASSWKSCSFSQLSFSYADKQMLSHVLFLQDHHWTNTTLFAQMLLSHLTHALGIWHNSANT